MLGGREIGKGGGEGRNGKGDRVGRWGGEECMKMGGKHLGGMMKTCKSLSLC